MAFNVRMLLSISAIFACASPRTSDFSLVGSMRSESSSRISARVDKADTAYCAVGIGPVTGAESRRLRQKLLSLVKAEGLEVDLGAYREFTNFQTNRPSNYNPKPGT